MKSSSCHTHKLVILPVIFLFFLSQQDAAAQRKTFLPMFPWDCPCKMTGSLPCPQPEQRGSRLYVHITDKQGYNLELWCDNYPTSGYEINISYPDGTIENVSNCIYWLGQNLVQITYSGALDSLLLPTGGKGYYVDSLIELFHHNFVGNRDTMGFFLQYKYYVDSVIKLKYESRRNAAGVSTRILEDLEESTLSALPNDTLPDGAGHYVAYTPESKKDTNCYYTPVIYDPDSRPQQVLIRDRAGGIATEYVHFLPPQTLYGFLFDQKTSRLQFRFAKNPRHSFINLAIPRRFWKYPVNSLRLKVNNKTALCDVKYAGQYFIATIHTVRGKGKVTIDAAE